MSLRIDTFGSTIKTVVKIPHFSDISLCCRLTVLFGVCPTYEMAVVCRFLTGAFNSIAVTSRAIVSEVRVADVEAVDEEEQRDFWFFSQLSTCVTV